MVSPTGDGDLEGLSIDLSHRSLDDVVVQSVLQAWMNSSCYRSESMACFFCCCCGSNGCSDLLLLSYELVVVRIACCSCRTDKSTMKRARGRSNGWCFRRRCVTFQQPFDRSGGAIGRKEVLGVTQEINEKRKSNHRIESQIRWSCFGCACVHLALFFWLHDARSW